MDEDIAVSIGFVIGNRQREQIVQILGSKGKLSAEKIAKFEHIPLNRVNKTLADLAQKKIVFEEGDYWVLTDKGQELEKEMKKQA